MLAYILGKSIPLRSYQSVLTPCDALGFIRVGVGKALDLTGLTTE